MSDKPEYPSRGEIKNVVDTSVCECQNWAEIGGSMNAEFEKELTHLINRHSIENEVDMPDFLLARMLCAMIESMGPTVKATLDWHGCDSVCHPRPNSVIKPTSGGSR